MIWLNHISHVDDDRLGNIWADLDIAELAKAKSPSCLMTEIKIGQLSN